MRVDLAMVMVITMVEMVDLTMVVVKGMVMVMVVIFYLLPSSSTFQAL